MGIRFEVYNESDSSLHKLFRTEEEALNCVCDEIFKIYSRPDEERRKIKYRRIEVPDIHFRCSGCHKEFYQDVDLTRVGAFVVCPFCHGHYYAKNCLAEPDERGINKGAWSIKCPTCGCGDCDYPLYEAMPDILQVFCPRCGNSFSVHRLSGTGQLNVKMRNGVYFFPGGCPDVKGINTIGEKWKTSRDSNLPWCRDAYSESIMESDLAFAALSFQANAVLDYECYIAPLGFQDKIGGFFSLDGHPRLYYRAMGLFAYIPDIKNQINGASLFYWCRDAEYRRSDEFRKSIPQTSKYDSKYIQYLSWETYSRYQITYHEYTLGSKSRIMEKLRQGIYDPNER